MGARADRKKGAGGKGALKGVPKGATQETAAAKKVAETVIVQGLPELVALSHSIHSTPELCYNETRSASAVADALRAGGLEVTEGAYEIETALESRSGTGELVIALCAEYDALPEVGHALSLIHI